MRALAKTLHLIGLWGCCPNGTQEENRLGKDGSGKANPQDDVNFRQLIYTYITAAEGQLGNWTSGVREALKAVLTCRFEVNGFSSGIVRCWGDASTVYEAALWPRLILQPKG